MILRGCSKTLLLLEHLLSIFVFGCCLVCVAVAAQVTPEDSPLVRSLANPLLSRGPTGSFDQLKIGPRAILREAPYDWKMWYEGVSGANRASVGYATSPDGIHWTKYPGNPIMTPSESWEGGPSGEISPNTVLKENGMYKMWYHAYDSRTKGRSIGYATSVDGISWTKYTRNPILKPGFLWAWDRTSIAEPKVVKVGSTYHMYYMRATGTHGVGLATSPDGINWIKHSGNPLLTVGPRGAWDDTWFEVGDVVWDGRAFHMWYRAQRSRFDGGGIGYAWSLDGKNWTKDPNNPLLTKPNPPLAKGDDHGLEGGLNVLRVDDQWWIYYAGMVFCCPENMGVNLAISEVKGSPKLPGEKMPGGTK